MGDWQHSNSAVEGFKVGVKGGSGPNKNNTSENLSLAMMRERLLIPFLKVTQSDPYVYKLLGADIRCNPLGFTALRC